MALRSKRTILLVFGTRPEAIKMAPLVKEFQKYPEKFEVLVCVTAQHREMLDQALKLFEITPNYDLNIMKAGQDLYDVTSCVLLGLRDVLKLSNPDLVLVHGDTSTSTAAALAAFYQKIPVGHIEAGLRTNNIYSPWPEEINRQVTSRIATYHFAPTSLSKNNLIKENIPEEKIIVTGNTVIDALFWIINKLNNEATLNEMTINNLIEIGLPQEKIFKWKESSKSADNSRRLVLITGHRRENFGAGFIQICEAIKELAKIFPNVDFVYPMHLNPNVRNAIASVFGEIDDLKQNLCESNIIFIEPIDYLPFIFLMKLSHLVLTDSGGVQEEAPSLGKPVLVMRENTERPESIDAGTVILVGTNKSTIIEMVSSLLNNKLHYQKMANANNPYGDGTACSKIAKYFVKHS